jgi:aminoglycoside phosphotransferase family enzyme/predicted kinase
MTHLKLLETMSSPEFYPNRPESVEVVQTHISFIFIAGNIVYKVKKSVDFGFLDFTSLEKRKHHCHEELRLNRRLAPDTYLDVAVISEYDDGRLFLGDDGRIVEYAVRMKRLPQERMLKKLLESGEADPSIMDRIAGRLAAFHRQAATGGEIDRIGGVETIRRNHEENFEQTAAYAGATFPERQYRYIRAYSSHFLEERRGLLEKRVVEHRIRDCHGDLHMEHIVVADGIQIFDCIEFNERFRFEDVAAEVAFLAMDLDYNGYPQYGERFVDAYIRESGDPEIRTLLNFYKCYYAYVRGKVVSFRTSDKAIRTEDRDEAVRIAAKYFDLAYTCAARLEKPALILVAGLMGTGKSVLAGHLASRLGAEVIRMDVLRKELQHLSPRERRFEDFGQGIYAEGISEKTYEKALEQAGIKLRQGKSVIIDASFKKRRDREKARAVAGQCLADCFVVECVCPEPVIRKRLEDRLADRTEASDGRWDIFEAQKNDFEKINESEGPSHLIADTSLPPETSAHAVLARIRGLAL